MDRTDYALVTNQTRPPGMSIEDLCGPVISPPIELPSAALLNEFKMAAQSLIEAYMNGDGQGSILTKHVAWFKELLD